MFAPNTCPRSLRAEGEKRLPDVRHLSLAATALDTTAMTDCSVSRCAVGEQVYISNSAAISRKDEPFDASPVMGLTLHMSRVNQFGTALIEHEAPTAGIRNAY